MSKSSIVAEIGNSYGNYLLVIDDNQVVSLFFGYVGISKSTTQMPVSQRGLWVAALPFQATIDTGVIQSRRLETVQSSTDFLCQPTDFRFQYARATLNFRVPRPYISHEVESLKIAV